VNTKANRAMPCGDYGIFFSIQAQGFSIVCSIGSDEVKNPMNGLYII